MNEAGEQAPELLARAAPADRATIIRAGVVAFVTGAAIMVLLHESSHAVAGALQGYRPTQLPFAVDYLPDPPPAVQARTAITGPLFSLISGFALYALDRAVRPFATRPYWRLVWLWTVFASIQEGFGYFFIAGFVSAGDTAVALGIWGAPTWMYYASTALGVGGLFLTARMFADPVSELSSSLSDKRAIAVWPWLYGTFVCVVLEILYVLLSPDTGAGSVFAVIFGTIAVGVYAPMSMMFRKGRTLAAVSPTVPVHPVAGYVLLGVLVAANLVLTRGWLWG